MFYPEERKKFVFCIQYKGNPNDWLLFFFERCIYCWEIRKNLLFLVAKLLYISKLPSVHPETFLGKRVFFRLPFKINVSNFSKYVSLLLVQVVHQSHSFYWHLGGIIMHNNNNNFPPKQQYQILIVYGYHSWFVLQVWFW